MPEGVSNIDSNLINYRQKWSFNTFQVRIRSFVSQVSLNDYLTRKYPPSKVQTQSYGSETVYVQKNGKNLFWINQNDIIFVSSEKSKTNNFPDDILNRYLQDYPPTCNVDWCNEIFIVLDKENFIFKNTKELEKEINDHTLKSISCPNRNPNTNQIKAKLRNSIGNDVRFDEAEFLRMVNECKNGKEAFNVPTNKGTPLFKSCVNKLKSKLAEKGISNYKEFDVISKCLIEEDFRQQYSNEINRQPDQFESLINNHIDSAVEEIEFKESTHERTEEDDESTYLDKDQQNRKEDDPNTFDSSQNYDESNFPTYPSETSENFFQRFLNYFKKQFKLQEWQQKRGG